MNEPGKSDKPVVPEKFANTNASMNFWEFFERVEQAEGRGLAKENGEDITLPPAGPAKQVDRTQSRVGEGDAFPEDLHSELDRVRQAACRDKQMKFTSLWHHVYNVERLREAYLALKL
jgi:RNA-directed DNA polymerase